MVRRSDALPVGAWLADIRGLHVSALCGENVETFQEGLVEGCWDGPFARHAFECADNMFGSGLKRLDGSVVLVTPSHTLEALYLYETSGRVVASNSLAFLLEHEGLEPPPGAAICRRLATLVLGVADQEQLLFEHATARVLRIAHAAIELRDGRLRVTPRTFERHYTDFADYRGYLLKTLRGMFENGASRQRRAALRPIASVSSGYDSNAGAALAAALGCQQALTLRNARNGHADSGQSVGEALGLEVLEFERPSEGAKVAAHDEAEFVATGMGGEDIALAAFEPALRGRILLTGFHGDKVWDPELRPNAVLARGDLSGSSLAEFRLRVGFVHVPVPFIGALRHDEVRQVGLSEEMAPWRIGTSYDRPIPRRVLEEVGVPRGLFGQTKKAASMLIFQKASIFSRPTQLELQEFAWSRGETSARWAQRKWWARYRFWCGARKAARAVTARPLPRWMEHIVLGDDWRVFEHSSPLASELAFRWALRRIRARYRFGQANPTSGASG